MFANFDYVIDMDFLHLRIITMIKLLKWLSHGSVYVNLFRKSNNSDKNSSHGISTQYRAEPWVSVSVFGYRLNTTKPKVFHQRLFTWNFCCGNNISVTNINLCPNIFTKISTRMWPFLDLPGTSLSFLSTDCIGMSIRFWLVWKCPFHSYRNGVFIQFQLEWNAHPILAGV